MNGSPIGIRFAIAEVQPIPDDEYTSITSGATLTGADVRTKATGPNPGLTVPADGATVFAVAFSCSPARDAVP